MCSPEGGDASQGSEGGSLWHFQGVLTRSQKPWAVLLKAEVNLFLKRLWAWGVTTHQELPS